MSNERQSRREFIGHSFRLGGLFAAFGSFNLWSAAKYGLQAIGHSEPVPARLLISQPSKLIDSFILARGGASVYYCQMFFPTFITGSEVGKVMELDKICQQRLMSDKSLSRPRLRSVPAIAAAHMLPIANETDAHALRSVFMKAHRAGFGEDDPCRLVLGFIWTCLGAALIRNKYSWERLIVGPEIVLAAEDICTKFVGGDDSSSPLIHTAVAAWQFLLSYQRALSQRTSSISPIDLQITNKSVNAIKALRGTRNAWLNQIERLYQDLNSYENMPPEYLELIIGRSQTKLDSPSRRKADLCVLIRLNLIYLSHLVMEGKLISPYLADARLAAEMNKRMFAFLVDYGVTPTDWQILKLQSVGLFSKDCVVYLDHVFEHFDDFARQADAGGNEARVAEWYSQNVPFKNSLAEEFVAEKAYERPEDIQSALAALTKPTNTNARLEYCLPALSYGFKLERYNNPALAQDKDSAIMERVREASVEVLRDEQYATAFHQLSKAEPFLRKRFDENTNLPARLSLAGDGGEVPLRRKEIVHSYPTQNEGEIENDFGISSCVKKRYFEKVRALGLSEEAAREFLEAGSASTQEPHCETSEKSEPEIEMAIKKRYFEKVRSLGLSEEAAKEFFEASLIE